MTYKESHYHSFAKYSGFHTLSPDLSANDGQLCKAAEVSQKQQRILPGFQYTKWKASGNSGALHVHSAIHAFAMIVRRYIVVNIYRDCGRILLLTIQSSLWLLLGVLDQRQGSVLTTKLGF